VQAGAGRPTVIIARTVKGSGLPFIEGRAESHYARLTDRQRQRALNVLRARAQRASESGRSAR
jgi:transketolase